nr:DNA translocase FtsK [Parvibaculum indicum]
MVRRFLANPLSHLPPAIRDFCAKRLQELAGLVLAGLGLFGLVALASFSIDDPSFNNATSNLPGNWMGLPGAYASDVLLQTLGLGALFFLIPLMAWGWRLLSHRAPGHPVFRVAAWLGGTLTAACFFGTMPRLFDWQLQSGLGGFLGDIFAALGLSLFVNFIGETGAYVLTAIVMGPVAVLALGYAIDLRREDVAALFSRLADARSERAQARREEPAGYRAGAVSRPRRRADEDEDEEDGDDDIFDRPDLEPGRLRMAIWTLSDSVTDFTDRLLRRGDFAPLSEEEREAARNNTGFGRRNADDEDDEEETPRRKKASARRERAAGARRVEPTASTKPAPKVSRTAPKKKTSKRAAAEAQPSLALDPESPYQLPPLSLLTPPKGGGGAKMSDDALEQNARLLESVLDDFGIKGEIINVRPGPVVTLYELEPAPGIKSSRVIALADDIARSMSAVSARVAVVSGRNAIGIELPNAKREMVYLRELLETQEYESHNSRLGLALGKNIGGEAVISDLSRMPHLLIAGTTGSGKSVGINTMILSLLYKLPPDRCKLIMVDPKMLELSVYDGIPHLLAPVVTDPKKAVVALKWVVKEMEDRYRKMSKVGVRNIEGYNNRVGEAAAKGEVLVRTVQTGFDKETGEAIYEEEEMDLQPMPFIVVIVDEMADLMMVAGKEIEAAVQRLAQMARAAGIHMITATQRPSVDVITGTIKANFPTRISFQVTSKIDSRTILGEQGAEQLLGQGDMLYMAGGGRIRRVHGPFVSDEEVEKVVSFLKKQGVPEYLDAITAEPEGGEGDGLSLDGGSSGDELYDKAVAIVARDKRASTSYIQRRLQIGYNRAARLIEMMEEQGVVSPPNHQGKREVLVGDHS